MQQLVEPHIQPKSWPRPCRSYTREDGTGRSSPEGGCSCSGGSATPRLWCDHHHIQERVWKPPKHHCGDQGKHRVQWRHPRDITARTSPASPCFKTRSILKKPPSSLDTYIHTRSKRRRNRAGTWSIMGMSTNYTIEATEAHIYISYFFHKVCI